MLALLGWNPGTEQEVFSMDELIEAFSIERVGKHGSKFDPEKAKWFNHHYLSALSNVEAAHLLQNQVAGKGINTELSYLINIVSLVKERATLIPDLWEQSAFFFIEPSVYDDKLKNKVWRPESVDMLNQIVKFLNDQHDFSAENLEHSLKDFIAQNG
jgi:glutamyl-tRNA synthetase